jgi:Ca2+-dependent lipid-binding protein
VAGYDPRWNESFWLPVNSYEDTMMIGLKANSLSKSKAFFSTEMEEKLPLKDCLLMTWQMH